MKAKRNVARESLFSEERKSDTSVKKGNFEENGELVINGKIFANTHKNEKKNWLRNTIVVANRATQALFYYVIFLNFFEI